MLSMVYTLDLQRILKITEDQFDQICRDHRDLKFERSAQGSLVIMSLTGGETGERNAEINGQLWLWNRQAKLGHLYDSSTGFRLPNGAIRSPDAAWVSQSRWQKLTPEQRKKRVPLCPDFVIELKSSTDEIEDLRLKMQEYLENGLRLGWLIDPDERVVEVYRSDQVIDRIRQPIELSADDILPGFILDLTDIL
jgi:Uma2 family endonuclease